MPDPTLMSPSQALAWTGAGAAALLGGAMLAAAALAGAAGASPARRAVIQWTPIAAAVGICLAFRQTGTALGIVFGTSVGLLSSAVGALCTIGPVGPAPARWKRVWPFTLAASLIVFVSGFNGLLTWKHGVALALEALVLWPLWNDRDSDHEWSAPLEGQFGSNRPLARTVVLVALAVTLACVGGWASLIGVEATSHFRARVSGGAIGASLLSLMLISPHVQGGRTLASLGASWLPVTGHVGVVLLNLCVLLPVVALLPYAEAWVRAVDFAHGVSLHRDTFAPQATVFPLATWRVDAVALVIVSVLFLPVSMGKWNLGKEEGAVLIVGYCVYLISVMAAAAY